MGLRWGVLSTARINQRFLPALRNSRRSTLGALASRSLDKARALGSEWGAARCYGDYGELVSDPEIDAVYIPLPNDLHCAWAERALTAGKHVLCEKPMAIGREELNSLMTRAADARRHLSEGLVHLHHPQWAAAKEVVLTGELGKIRTVQGSYSLDFRPYQSIIFDRERGGGALWGLGVYPLSGIMFLLGDVNTSAQGIARWGDGVDLTFAGLLDFEYGPCAEIFCSITSCADERFRVIGDRGTLEFDHPYRPDLDGNGNGFTITSNSGTRTVRRFDHHPPFEAQIRSFEDVTLDGAEPTVSLNLSDRVNRAALMLFSAAGTHVGDKWND